MGLPHQVVMDQAVAIEINTKFRRYFNIKDYPDYIMNYQQNFIQKDLFLKSNAFCIWNENELPGLSNVHDKNSMDLIKSLGFYSCYSLNDLSNAKLMNRVDSNAIILIKIIRYKGICNLT